MEIVAAIEKTANIFQLITMVIAVNHLSQYVGQISDIGSFVLESPLAVLI